LKETQRETDEMYQNAGITNNNLQKVVLEIFLLCSFLFLSWDSYKQFWNFHPVRFDVPCSVQSKFNVTM